MGDQQETKLLARPPSFFFLLFLRIIFFLAFSPKKPVKKITKGRSKKKKIEE